MFSERAVVAPFRGGRALMIRVADERNNQLTEVSATVSLSFTEDSPAGPLRRFRELRLDRPRVRHGRHLLPGGQPRSSYRAGEVAWGARFADMFLRTGEGLVGVDMRKLHDVEPAPDLPA